MFDKLIRKVKSTIGYVPEGKYGTDSNGSDKWLHPEIDDEEYDNSFIRAVKTYNKTHKSLFYVVDLSKSFFKLNPGIKYSKEELDQALLDWFDYDKASVMKSFSKGEDIRNFVGASGWSPNQDEQKLLKRQAVIIQSAAVKTNSGHGLLYRGFSLKSEADFEKFFPKGKTLTMDSLTASSPDRKISEIYTNPSYIGLGDGQGVRVLMLIENPNGNIGVNRDDVETILPKGVAYKITGTWQDGDYHYISILSNEVSIETGLKTTNSSSSKQSDKKSVNTEKKTGLKKAVGVGLSHYVLSDRAKNIPKLSKSELHKEKLIKKPVQVHGKDGKIFTRMQWVDPKTGKPVEHDHVVDSAPPKNTGNKGKQTIMVSDPEHFDNHIKKKYSKEHLIDQARKQGIAWDEKEHPAMNWMRAAMAIKNHIKSGNIFHVEHNEKDVDGNMESKGKSKVDKFLLDLLEKHGSKEKLMEWARSKDIGWKEHSDPAINWMRAAMSIKQKLMQGKMVDGVRTQQKQPMKEANTVITQDIKDFVKDLGKNHPRDKIMQRAEDYGITWDKKDHPAMNWMRAASSIQKFIAQGGKFDMTGEINTNTQGDDNESMSKIKLTKYQQVANEMAKRVSSNLEPKVKSWGVRSLLADNKDMSEEQAHDIYDQLVQKSKESKLMIHFDPNHLIRKGTTMLDQMTTDGRLKNMYELGIGDKENREYYERQLFGGEYDDAENHERPIYGCLDMYNKGLKSSSYGSVSLVLKNDVKDRTTCLHTDSYNLEHDTEGKLTRHANFAHQALANIWMTKWKNPKGYDKLRQRSFNSVLNGETNNDSAFFEAQVHGGVDLKRDIDHILVPNEWQKGDQFKDVHSKIQNLAKLCGTQVKYE